MKELEERRAQIKEADQKEPMAPQEVPQTETAE